MRDQIHWPDDGLIPAVIQHDESDEVLMVGFMNSDALARTRDTGLVHFYSRSRDRLWQKGESSGHVQRVRDIRVNCEKNSLLIRVEQIGAVCHDGFTTCYYRRLTDDEQLEIVRDRMFDPRDVYGDGLGIEGTARVWWGAYAYLRDHDLTSESSTSRILRSDTSVANRIGDEFAELAGVLDGTHVHADQRSDALLEGSQCCYWLVVEAIRRGYTFEDVRPDRALDVTVANDPLPISRLLSAVAVTDDLSAADIHALFAHVGNAVAAIGIEPRALLDRDLAELRTRPYLARWFER